mmetsp:Transcript_11741/g.27177  ORF Transcript_11741/g.27177 Transcript_11741/m.27177 type:complete len:756 (+) Transcript_11741:68-2335(+)
MASVNAPRLELNLAAVRAKPAPMLPLINSGSQSARQTPASRSDGDAHSAHGAAQTARAHIRPPQSPGGVRGAHPQPPKSPMGEREGAPRPAGALSKGGLDRLEQRWTSRKTPAKAPSRPESGGSNSTRLPTGARTCPTCGQQTSERDISRITQRLSAATPDSEGLDPADEMALLLAMMASNDVEAAEAKLAEIIEAAEADGVIDDDEQLSIDTAQAEVTAMRQKKDEADAAQRKAQEQAELQALLVNNDVEAAEKLLAEIIVAAEADGFIDEEEQREIDEATAQLKGLRAKKMLMEKRKNMIMQGKLQSKQAEEKAAHSIAQREVAAERLRLATELRELKLTHKKLKDKHAAATALKLQLQQLHAATEEDLARVSKECADLKKQLSGVEKELEALTEKHLILEKELQRTRAQASARQGQVEGLQDELQQQKDRTGRETSILLSKHEKASSQAADLAHRLNSEGERATKLERENRQLNDSTTLEKQSAQLERAACDKFRVRCAEMEERWSQAMQRNDTLTVDNQRLAAELEETEAALAEAALWHKARVAGRATTRLLITMPPETQELFLQEQQFQDADCIMVAEFLIQNLMIVHCDLSRNSFGPQGATALAQALRSNRVLTSLSLKDNQVGPEGAEKLAAMLHDNRTIERLNLMGCAVGDQGVEALAGALALAFVDQPVPAPPGGGLGDREEGEAGGVVARHVHGPRDGRAGREQGRAGCAQRRGLVAAQRRAAARRRALGLGRARPRGQRTRGHR